MSRKTALFVCLLLAIAHTWPLATAPHILSRNDNGDTMLNEWILAWIQHQLPRDPLHLFEANIFYPAHDTLAFSEPLLVPAVMGAPVRWLGGSPVLVYNLLLIAGFALTAFAAYTVIRDWTGDSIAALIAASAFAFNTHLLSRLPHLQAIHAWGLPLALLAVDRLLASDRTHSQPQLSAGGPADSAPSGFRWKINGGAQLPPPGGSQEKFSSQTQRLRWGRGFRPAITGDALRLALWMIAMGYTSGHLLIFATVMIAIVLVARPADWVRRPFSAVATLSLAAALSAAALIPLYIPYRRVALEQGLVRELANVSEYSATLKGYLASASRVHFSMWSAGFFEDSVDAFFPGIAVVALSAAAVILVWRQPRPDKSLMKRRVVMLVAIGLGGALLSLGPSTPVYGWFYWVFPPLRTVRAAARFGNLFLLAMALLAGIGLARLRAAGTFGRRGTAVGLALIALVNVELLRAPVTYRRFHGIPGLYSILAQEARPVVLVEQPFYPPEAVFENAEYVLNSTAHWRPLMNGYSGFTPESYRRFAETFWYFPREHAIEAMRRAGVTHVMVHPRRFERHAAETMRLVAASPYLERVAVGRDEMTLYRLR